MPRLMERRRREMRRSQPQHQKRFTSLSHMSTRRRLTLTRQTSELLSTERKRQRKLRSENRMDEMDKQPVIKC